MGTVCDVMSKVEYQKEQAKTGNAACISGIEHVDTDTFM